MNNVNTIICPRDNSELKIMNRNGIEIEYCERCGGVWLDRGELEKLINMSSEPKYGPPDIGNSNSHRNSYNDNNKNYEDRSYNNRENSGYQNNQQPKKKESWLGELFDFGV
jgi:uncharacterized protein